MTKTSVPTEAFAGAVTSFADDLADYEEEINGLNVYPVPDGDTGTNLRLTLQAVVRELDGSTDPCASVIRGSLMGARGQLRRHPVADLPGAVRSGGRGGRT